MKRYWEKISSIALLIGLGISLPALAQCQQQLQWNCLPEGRQLSDVVSATAIEGNINRITVAQTLNELGARCQNQQLVDRSGREIQFYQLQGCWGNPPVNYGEILRQQSEEIAKLQETYTVIEMTCNSSGIPYP